MSLMDMFIGQMQGADQAKMQVWIQEHIIVPTVEELLKPENLVRLANALKTSG